MHIRMDVRRWIFFIMIIITVLVLMYPKFNMGIEKRCLQDEDCDFAKMVCCPSCIGGVDVLNKKFADRQNQMIDEKCKETTCPPLFCASDFGSALYSVPVCEHGVCTTTDMIQCSAVCSYYDKRDRHPFNLYLNHTAEYEGMGVDELALDCGC